MLILLYGRLIGRITRLARLSVCPSVRLSVCLSRTGSYNSKTKNRRKVKIGVDVPHGTSKWSANFLQFERAKANVTGRKNLQSLVLSLLTDCTPTPLLRLL